jgi:hypothetical protein
VQQSPRRDLDIIPLVLRIVIPAQGLADKVPKRGHREAALAAAAIYTLL